MISGILSLKKVVYNKKCGSQSYLESHRTAVDIDTLKEFPIEYAAIYLSILGAYWGLFNSVKKNQFARPLLVASTVATLLTLLLGYAGALAGLPMHIAWGVPSIPGLIFVFSVWLVSKGRDIGGINVGEVLSSDLANIDKQFSFILSGILEGISKELLMNAIRNAFSFILGSLYKLLKLGVKDDSHICVLHASGGRLAVVASERVSATHADTIEREFRYGNRPKGLAGQVATLQATIYIPDLEDKKDENIKLWIPLDHSERKVGSIICIPLVRQSWRTRNSVVIGVLNLTSLRKKAFGTPYQRQLIDLFGNKLEILLSLLEIVQNGDR